MESTDSAMFKLTVLFCLAAAAFRTSPTTALPLSDQRIVGGSDTTIEQYPYQVSVQYYGKHVCGGSIIGERDVITAAHCLNGTASGYTIRAGTTSRGSGGDVYSVSRVARNAQYNSLTMAYNYALIQIQGQFALGASQAIVALPEQDEDVPAGTPAVVTGWGALRESGASPIILQQVEVPIVDRVVCNSIYGGGITAHDICAGILGQGGKGACQGDDGGPLVADDKLVGIVSWGYGCARPDYPGVYARVAVVRNWIRDNSGI